MTSSAQDETVIVVGAGIIGIACAHYLSKAGLRVTVIDKGSIAGACSHANCGYICPSHVLPLTEPGAIGVAIKSSKPGSATTLHRGCGHWGQTPAARCQSASPSQAFVPIVHSLQPNVPTENGEVVLVSCRTDGKRAQKSGDASAQDAESGESRRSSP